MHVIENILNDWDIVMEEYRGIKRTMPLYGWDDDSSMIADWRAVTLWWNGKPFTPVQKKMPHTTELLRHGPSHRATGWLILNPHSHTPVHTHRDWEHRIIVHIPTYIPEGDVGFVVDGTTYRWKYGEVFAFDCYREHYGFNNTDEPRSIMVFDFDYDQYIDQLKPFMHV